MLLLRKLGASLNEQIAGLLHDASHTAFSHTADWVLGHKETEDYQDIHHERILRRFGIPAISSKAAARAFGETYLKCQTEHWGGAEAVIRYTLLSDALLLGLEQKIISTEDFYQDDEFVLGKLWRSNDLSIERTLRRLQGKLEYVEDSVNPTIVSRKKFRYVDPGFLDGSVVGLASESIIGKQATRVRRLSEVDESYQALIQRHREINEKGIRVRVVG